MYATLLVQHCDLVAPLVMIICNKYEERQIRNSNILVLFNGSSQRIVILKNMISILHAIYLKGQTGSNES